MYRPTWKGFRKTEVVFDPNEEIWQIRNMDTGERLGTYGGEELYPVGLRTWNLSQGICAGEDTSNIHLMLSRCVDVIIYAGEA